MGSADFYLQFLVCRYQQCPNNERESLKRDLAPVSKEAIKESSNIFLFEGFLSYNSIFKLTTHGFSVFGNSSVYGKL